MPSLSLPAPTIEIQANRTVCLHGAWQVHQLAQAGMTEQLLFTLKKLSAESHWDLSELAALDHIGAQLLWRAWGGTRPGELNLAPQDNQFFERLERTGALVLPPDNSHSIWSISAMNLKLYQTLEHLTGFIGLLGQLILDLARFGRKPLQGPWKEISANVFHAGYQALGITALVGFLIGIVLSYLSAQQLRTFGGDIYLVNILGMSVIRELGPLLAAILVAGRSGSSITAQLGVMRVTEELDAMLVMGLPHGFRLVMPKVLALAVAMPLLVIWTDAMALLGGMVAAKLELGMSMRYFIAALPDAVPLANYWIGLGKGVAFGSLIALVSCHFGLRIQPNTESLGRGTTTSVVTGITIVILADAIFAILFNGVGF